MNCHACDEAIAYIDAHAEQLRQTGAWHVTPHSCKIRAHNGYKMCPLGSILIDVHSTTNVQEFHEEAYRYAWEYTLGQGDVVFEDEDDQLEFEQRDDVEQKVEEAFAIPSLVAVEDFLGLIRNPLHDIPETKVPGNADHKVTASLSSDAAHHIAFAADDAGVYCKRVREHLVRTLGLTEKSPQNGMDCTA